MGDLENYEKDMLRRDAELDRIQDELRWSEFEPEVCGIPVVFGGSDPSGAECDKSPGHGDDHEGDSPFGEGRVSWSGGGTCAGDALPVSNVTFH